MSDPLKDCTHISFDATAPARAAVASLDRTEDIRFSPSARRLAVAAFLKDRIAVFDVEITSGGDAPRVGLTGGVYLSSSALNGPHGLDFVEEDKVVVTNRGGDAVVFALPRGTADMPLQEARLIRTLPGGGENLLNAPGSVAVAGVEDGIAEVFICNNEAHTVTRHLLDASAECSVKHAEVLLRKWLDIPDGISVTRDRRWIAVSNHTTHDVLLYENGSALDAHADPAGMLRGVHYPHGLRFSADGRLLFVADAGAPYVQVYASGADEWRGVAHPTSSIRIMDDAVFRRGAYRHDEGGPKGIDLDSEMRVLVTTSKHQPLGFFDLQAIAARVGGASNELRREQNALNVGYELRYLEESRVTKAKAREAEHMTASRSWRLTAPLRRIFDAINSLARRA